MGKHTNWLPAALPLSRHATHPPLPPSCARTSHRTFSPEAKNLITRLLSPDRSKRLGCLRGGASDVKDHPWFGLGLASGRMNWDKVYRGELLPPHVPRVRDASDTSNFDKYPDSDGETAKELSASDNALFSALEAL